MRCRLPLRVADSPNRARAAGQGLDPVRDLSEEAEGDHVGHSPTQWPTHRDAVGERQEGVRLGRPEGKPGVPPIGPSTGPLISHPAGELGREYVHRGDRGRRAEQLAATGLDLLTHLALVMRFAVLFCLEGVEDPEGAGSEPEGEPGQSPRRRVDQGLDDG